MLCDRSRVHRGVYKLQSLSARGRGVLALMISLFSLLKAFKDFGDYTESCFLMLSAADNLL